jgi:hypothetical protein
MEKYHFTGIDIAMQILRPGATYEISGLEIIKWDDPRPQPTVEELVEMISSIKKFEDNNVMLVVNENNETIETDAQEFMKEYFKQIST